MGVFQKCKKVWAVAFLAIAFTVWLLDIFWRPKGYHYVSYFFIVFCFVTSLIFIDKCKDKIFQSVALLFTAVADYFLILLQGQQKTLAMVFFLLAQVAYALRTVGFTKSKRERIVNLAVRAGASAIIATITAIVLAGDKDLPLFLLSVVYYANLVVSIVFSFLHCKEGKHILVTAIGLLLFSLCDISIGFDFLIDIFSLGQGNFIYDFMHSGVSFVAIFYPPSQALLAFSSYFTRLENKTKTAV